MSNNPEQAVATEIILLETERQLEKIRLQRAMYKTALENLLFVIDQLSLDTKEKFVEGVKNVAEDIETYIKKYINK